MIKEYLHWVEEREQLFQQLAIREEWVPVIDYPYYKLSTFGRVLSLPRKGTKGGLLKLGEQKTYKPTHSTVG